MAGKGGADMVGASALACSGDFLLRLAGCQREDLRSPRFDELRLRPAAFAVVVGGRPCRRAGAAALVAVVGVLAEVVFFICVPLL